MQGSSVRGDQQSKKVDQYIRQPYRNPRLRAISSLQVNSGKNNDTYSRAGRVRYDLVFRVVGVKIYTTDVHRSIGGRCRDYDFLRTTLQVGGSLVDGGENAL